MFIAAQERWLPPRGSARIPLNRQGRISLMNSLGFSFFSLLKPIIFTVFTAAAQSVYSLKTSHLGNVLPRHKTTLRLPRQICLPHFPKNRS